MIIQYKNKNNEDGSMDFSMKLSDAEVNFLINFALESLIQIGAITVQENSEEPQEVKLPIPQAYPSNPDTPTSAH